MSKYIESRVKHEVSIIKKDQISLANEVNERISKESLFFVSNKASTGHQNSEQSERSERTKDIKRTFF